MTKSKTLWTFLSVTLVLIGYVSVVAPAFADHPGFILRAQHQGANDPTTEGFGGNGNGTSAHEWSRDISSGPATKP